MASLITRGSLIAIALVGLAGCSQEEMLQKFSSPQDQAAAKNYIDHLRARNFDEIEKTLDPSIRTPDMRDRLVQMAEAMPTREPDSIKVVGAQRFSTADATTISTAFEYNFGDKWVLAHVTVGDRQGTKTIVGFNITPMAQSLEAQNRFTLAGKSAVQYSVLVAAIAAVLVTFYSLVVCIKTKLSERKWLWVIFILVGFGKLAVNWTTGEWGFVLLAVQLFSASAVAPLYGPWTIAVSVPVGAIAFLFYKRPRAVQVGAR